MMPDVNIFYGPEIILISFINLIFTETETEMRYKLRSHKQHARCTEPRPGSGDCQEDAGPASSQVRRKQKTSEQRGATSDNVFLGQKLSVFSLPQDMVLMIVEFLDVESALSFLRTSKVRDSIKLR